MTLCRLCCDTGVRGRLVRVVDIDSLSPDCCGFESCQGLWILSCEEAIQLAYGVSVVLLRCLLVTEGLPKVFLHQ